VFGYVLVLVEIRPLCEAEWILASRPLAFFF
jgi:hypothetical protein